MEVKERRKHLFKHRDYLNGVATSIFEIQPTKQEIFNTLLNMYQPIWSEGYITRLEDSIYFRDRRNTRREESWNSVKDQLDDLIHNPKTA
jgi:hypothetical protein